MECIYFWLDTFNDLQVTQPPFFHVFLFVITEPFTNRVEESTMQIQIIYTVKSK